MRIIAQSEREKQELVAASRHIHDADVNTDIYMVNFIAHIYRCPELIEVYLTPSGAKPRGNRR